MYIGLGFSNMLFFFVRMEIVHLGIYIFWFLSSSQFNALKVLILFYTIYDRILNSIKIIFNFLRRHPFQNLYYYTEYSDRCIKTLK